jgi:hypothetical protein
VRTLAHLFFKLEKCIGMHQYPQIKIRTLTCSRGLRGIIHAALKICWVIFAYLFAKVKRACSRVTQPFRLFVVRESLDVYHLDALSVVVHKEGTCDIILCLCKNDMCYITPLLSQANVILENRFLILMALVLCLIGRKSTQPPHR